MQRRLGFTGTVAVTLACVAGVLFTAALRVERDVAANEGRLRSRASSTKVLVSAESEADSESEPKRELFRPPSTERNSADLRRLFAIVKIHQIALNKVDYRLEGTDQSG